MTEPTTSAVGYKFIERMPVRFGATFTANLLRAGLSFLSGVIIARGLGASAYGDLSFLIGSFTAISSLLDFGSSQAFYTFISRRRQKAAFFVLYSLWTFVIQFGGTFLLLRFLFSDRMISRIWVGHDRSIVILAFGATFVMSQAWGMASQLGEATRKTVVIQIAAVVQALAHVGLIAAAAHWGWLTVRGVLWLLVGEYVLLAGVVGPMVLGGNIATPSETPDTVGTIVRDLVRYCRPLALYGIVSFFYTFADRWMLQEYGGSKQQGFFSVGQQFANIGLIATTSILNVFWKEVAEAGQRQDLERTQELYSVVGRTLYFFGAWISCMLIPHTREILAWTVGEDFKSAWLPLALMLVYPIHQSLGQIQGTFFLASGDTPNYTRIGLFMMGLSLPLTYLLLAPKSAALPGLNLGAIGLAVKLVVIQILGVTLRGYVLARTNGWRYDYSYQILMLGVLLGLSFLCRAVVQAFFGFSSSANSVAVVILCCTIYMGLSLAGMVYAPHLLGLAPVKASIARHMHRSRR